MPSSNTSPFRRGSESRNGHKPSSSPIPHLPSTITLHNHHLSYPSAADSNNCRWQIIRSSTIGPVPLETKMMVADQCGVCGILYKWVNYGRGWRPRWFVLQDGVLSYFKIHGNRRIVINRNMSERSPTKVVGEESLRWISRHSRSQSRLSNPLGEIHLKVSSITENQSDDKRFWVYTGMKRLHLRAENGEDRRTWIEALRAVKEMYPRISNSCEILVMERNVPAVASIWTERLRQRLLEEGVREEAIKDSEHIMRDEFTTLYNNLVALKQKQIMLVETLRQLETEKVDLENTVIGETRRQLKCLEASTALTQDGSPSESDDHRDSAIEEETDDDENENEFFDTREFLSSSSFRSGASELLRSPYDSFDDEEMSHVEDGIGAGFPHVTRRKKLPAPAEKEKGVSLWSMIKDNIGKDLTKVCLPVHFNEPISTLQKSFEDLEYSYLLDRAYEWGRKGNSLMRALNVAAFAVSGYASTEGRHCKPFNPLLGETYEADYPDKGIRFFSEKVSHHPMIIACHCEGQGWKIWGDSNLKSKFWGRSIQLDPVGILTLEFDDGEVFQWSKVTTSIYNLILGKIYCDHYGTMHIKGNQEYSCKLKFKEQSIMDRNPHQVQGVVQDKNGESVATLFGKWDDSMYYVNGESSEKGKSSEHRLLWKRAKPSKYPSKYNLTPFAITLNELTPGFKEKLPPTDSRLRPDQRCLENGQFEMANSEKLRLEQRQRKARGMQEKGWKPRWFAKENGSNTYRYIGGYWEARENGNWESCPDIFGQLTSDQNLD